MNWDWLIGNTDRHFGNFLRPGFIHRKDQRDIALATKVGLRQAAAAEIADDSVPA